MIKKLHFQIEYFISFFKRNFIFIFFGLTLGSLVFIFQDKLISLPQKPIFYTKIIGIEGRYSLDNLPSQVTNLITQSLIIHSSNNKPLPSDLVDSFEIENEHKDYIFHLKKDISWHNGKKFDSSDINYQIPGLEISPIDKYTLKISTQDAFSPLLSLLDRPLFLKNLIGLGDYFVKKIQYQYDHVKSITLEPKDKNKNKIIFRFYPNQKDLITAFQLGEVDEIQVNQIPSELTNQKKIQIDQTIQTNNYYIAIFLNTGEEKKFENKQLRQSLAYATDKTTDKNERCLGPISPNSWAYNSAVKQYNYDPQRAKELLSDSAIDIKTINLSISSRDLLALAEEIKKSWKDTLNIDTSITVKSQIDQENFEAILGFYSIPLDPDQYPLWHSTQNQGNLSHLKDERIDKLLEEGRQIFDLQERKRVYLDFQKYLLEESPAIFLSYPTVYTINRLK